MKLAGLLLACAAIALSLGTARAEKASPFIFASSDAAPFPSRGWVMLLPGTEDLSWSANKAHYEAVAKLLNANGFDTLTVPFEEAYDEALDGDPDADGDRIAAVARRAVAWMQDAKGVEEDAPGAVVAWGDGALGVWPLVRLGGRYPLTTLVAAVAFYPSTDDEAPFSSRIPVLVQVGADDDMTPAADLRRHLNTSVAGSVGPVFAAYPGAAHGFDLETLTAPKTVRSLPLIGPGATLAYNAQAAVQARQKMLTFLKARLEAPE